MISTLSHVRFADEPTDNPYHTPNELPATPRGNTAPTIPQVFATAVQLALATVIIACLAVRAHHKHEAFVEPPLLFCSITMWILTALILAGQLWGRLSGGLKR